MNSDLQKSISDTVAGLTALPRRLVHEMERQWILETQLSALLGDRWPKLHAQLIAHRAPRQCYLMIRQGLAKQELDYLEARHLVDVSNGLFSASAVRALTVPIDNILASANGQDQP